jgi:nitrogen fixation protein NifU and related proteins
MSIYQEIILDHYRSPHNFGLLSQPTGSVKLSNPLCGDKIQMDIIIEGDVVKDVKFSGQGCAISTASASMLTDYAKSKTVTELQKLDMKFILELLGIELSPNRLKCALLPLEALQKVIA